MPSRERFPSVDALAAALARLGQDADAILVADLDRLGEVHAEDPDDPSRNLIRQVMGAVIEYEKNTAVKWMRDGMRAKATAGRKATGDYAYGYHGVGKGKARDAAPRPDEQAAVARVVELRKDDKSYREIAAILDAEGHRPRRAASWSAMSVQRVAQRAMDAAAR